MNSSPTPAPSSPDATADHHGLTAAEQADFGDVFVAAQELVRREGRVSIASFEINLGVSYCRAIRIADALERLGHAPPQLLKRQLSRFQPIAA